MPIMIDDVKHNRIIFPRHKHIHTIKHLPKFTNRKTKNLTNLLSKI